MTIVLQESLRAVFYAPYYAAMALDAYKDEGLEIGFKSAASPDVAARGLLDGSVHVAWGGPMRVMQTYARQPDCDLVCFGEVVTRDPFLLLGRSPKPNFKLTDLLSLRVATVSEVPTPWMCLQEDLRRAGLDPSKVARVSNQSMGQNAEALQRGDVDVVQLFEPYVEGLVESGAGHIWHAQASRGPTCYTTFYARRPVLAEKREACKRRVRALYRTQKWFHAAENRRIAEVMRPYFADVPAARLTNTIDRYKMLGIWGRNPRLPLSGYDRLRAGLVSGSFVPTGTPYETAVDNSLAEAIIAENPPALAR